LEFKGAGIEDEEISRAFLIELETNDIADFEF
jgi:hypothetical protein